MSPVDIGALDERLFASFLSEADAEFLAQCAD